MKKEFYDLNHARSYLSDSIIRLGNEPIYVTDVGVDMDGYWEITYNPLLKMETKNVVLRNNRINLDPVELGWINMEAAFSKTITLMRGFRRPIRAWKVGLSNGNFFTEPYVNRYTNILRSVGLYNTIMGIYPSVEQCIDKGNHAFSRSFALNTKRELQYLLLDEPVGKVYKDRIQLAPEYYYLSELLGKDMGN